MTAEELGAIVEEAHRMRVRVAAHVEGLDAARLAVSGGVDTIEHGLSLHREPRLLEMMAEHGIVLVPTLSIVPRPRRTLPDGVCTCTRRPSQAPARGGIRNPRGGARGGVTLAMGHDSGPPGTNAIELVRMVDCRLSPLEGIVAATQGSARALGLPDVGTITPGAAADLIVVGGDPIADVRVLIDPARIWLVLEDGRVVGGRAQQATAGASTPA